MPTKLPYVNQPGSMTKILEKARTAKTPERFTTDFLKTKLGFRGGNYQQFIPLAKKMGLLESDGRPTELYSSFRNEQTSRAAMAGAIRNAYRELFERDEHTDALDRKGLKGLVVQATGLDTESRVVQLVCQTFDALRKLADFDAPLAKGPAADDGTKGRPVGETSPDGARQDLDLNLSYTFNLVLPKSDDPAVFNAIFRSLRENLLRR